MTESCLLKTVGIYFIITLASKQQIKWPSWFHFRTKNLKTCSGLITHQLIKRTAEFYNWNSHRKRYRGEFKKNGCIMRLVMGFCLQIINADKSNFTTIETVLCQGRYYGKQFPYWFFNFLFTLPKRLFSDNYTVKGIPTITQVLIDYLLWHLKLLRFCF